MSIQKGDFRIQVFRDFVDQRSLLDSLGTCWTLGRKRRGATLMLPWPAIEIADHRLSFGFQRQAYNYQIYLDNESYDRWHYSLWPMIWNGKYWKFQTSYHINQNMMDEIEENTNANEGQRRTIGGEKVKI